MHVQVVNANRPEPDVIARAAALVKAGGVVAYPTDTFYGLGADPRSAVGVAAVFRAKGREASEALPLIAASLEDVERAIGRLGPTARRVAARFWPGPVTLVVPLPDGVLDDRVSAGRGSVALRVPDHEVARALAAAVGGLITSTSANRSGETPSARAADVVRAVGAMVSLVLDAGATAGGHASTIVDVRAAHPRLIRAGQVAFDRVLESLQ